MNKSRLIFCLAAAAALVSGDLATGTTIKVNSRKFTSEPTMRRRTTITLLEAGPVVSGSWLIAGDAVSLFTDTNGVAWYSNVLAGAYRLDIAGSPSRSFPITVFDTNGIVDAQALVNTTNYNTSFYTTPQVDSLIGDLQSQIDSLEVGGLSFVPQLGSGNLTNWSALDTNVLGSLVGSSPNALTNGDTRAIGLASSLSVTSTVIANGNLVVGGVIYGNAAGVTNLPPKGFAATNTGTAGQVFKKIDANTGYWADDNSSGSSSGSATNVYYGGSVTTSNVLTKIASGERTNANAFMGFGGVQLSTTVYGQTASGNYNYRNGVEFWEPGWDGTPRLYSDLANHPWGFIHVLTNWGGSTGPQGHVMHIASPGSIRIEANYGEPVWGQHYVRLGNEDGNAPVVINYSAFSTTNPTTGNGYSLPLTFESKGVVGGVTYSARPGIMGWFSGGLSSGPSSYDGVYSGILRFYSRTPTPDISYRTYGNDFPSTPIEVGQTSTNGWRLYGPVNLQQSVTYAVGTNVYLDFNGPSSQTIYLQSGVLTNFLQLTNVNVYRGSTNFEQRTFRLIAGGLDRPMRYPAWSTVSETGSTTPSSLLAAQKVMLLRLTAWGDGDTNVVCEFGTGTDATWAFDSDAAAFFTAASISDATQKGAVDTMTKALKGLNLWTNFVALWPMVGGNATAHSLNLVNSALYPWTWVATPTQDGNGVTGNGSSQYGTTTFNWSTHMGGQALTNFHAAVYVRTTTPTDGGAFIGGRNGSSIGVGITREGASAGVRGVMSTLGPNAVVNLSTDLRGPIILTRANSFAAFDMATRLTAITTTSSDAVSVPSITPYLLAYNYNASASSFSSANIAFASVGWGFTAAQLAQVKAVIENYEAALSRNVP